MGLSTPKTVGNRFKITLPVMISCKLLRFSFIVCSLERNRHHDPCNERQNQTCVIETSVAEHTVADTLMQF
jgi:hypothetical protein